MNPFAIAAIVAAVLFAGGIAALVFIPVDEQPSSCRRMDIDEMIREGDATVVTTQ